MAYKIWIAPVVRTVTIDANYYDNPTNETTSNFGLYYSLDNGSDTLITAGNNITTTCSNMTTLYISPGQTLYVGFKYDAGKLESGRDFDTAYANEGASETSCPDTLNLHYCGTKNVGGNPFGINISTNNIQIALTIAVIYGSFSQSC
jgi:hypothetical protein